MRILKKQIPLKYLYLLGVMVIVLVSIGLYQTYAMFTANVDSGNALNLVADVTYDLGINGTQNFTVSPDSSLAFNAQLSNNTNDSIYYEIYYSSNDDLNDVIVAELVDMSNIVIPTYDVVNDTTYPWIQLADGTYKSQTQGVNSSTTNLTVTFTLTESFDFSFDYSVSSESASYDYLYYTITNSSGTVIDSTGTSNKIGGTSYGTSDEAMSYITKTHTLEAGSYTVVFTYKKDSSDNSGTDAGYVRNIKIGYVSKASGTSGTLSSGSNKTVPLAIINNGTTTVDVTVGVVNTALGNSITYGTNNYPSGSKITAVYDANEITNGCDSAVECITKTVNGVEKVYCRKSDYVDLVISSNIGRFSHGLYNVTTNCDNADSTFLTKTRQFAISNMTNYSVCEATYTALSPSNYTTLYQQIINDYNNGNNTKNIYKEEHTLSGGSTYSEYRYEGTDTAVENYVWFNNELWRIIGAFPGGTPSTMSGTTFVQGNGAPSTKNTVKIIRNEAIGSFAWDITDTNGTNDWTNAELNTNILNNLYLNSQTGTCDFYSTSVAKACSFSENGLLSVQDYIEDATWNLGGWNTRSVYTTDMYNYERGTTICSGCSYPLLTTAKVGLMYPSDYGYSVASDSCQTGTKLDSYGNCGKDGWLLKYSNEWTQSLHSGNTYNVFRVSNTASLIDTIAKPGYSARPVVYLKSNIYVTGGDGSINNPYQVGL